MYSCKLSVITGGSLEPEPSPYYVHLVICILLGKDTVITRCNPLCKFTIYTTIELINMFQKEKYAIFLLY